MDAFSLNDCRRFGIGAHWPIRAQGTDATILPDVDMNNSASSNDMFLLPFPSGLDRNNIRKFQRIETPNS
jgi:hypothetical protein